MRAIRILADGRCFAGSDLQILDEMRQFAFCEERSSLSRYIPWLADTVSGLTGWEIRVAGDDPDSAKTLVDAILELGLAVELDVDPTTICQGECAGDTLDGNEWNA